MKDIHKQLLSLGSNQFLWNVPSIVSIWRYKFTIKICSILRYSILQLFRQLLNFPYSINVQSQTTPNYSFPCATKTIVINLGVDNFNTFSAKERKIHIQGLCNFFDHVPSWHGLFCHAHVWISSNFSSQREVHGQGRFSHTPPIT